MALDVMGYSLHYYSGDYLPVVSGNSTFIATQTSSDLVNTSYSKDMYNGNIARMVTTITNPNTRAVLPLGNAYKYDQLNRLSTALSFTNLNTSTNTWGSGGTGIYANNFTYDANGNILTQVRKNESGTTIDDLTYKYQQNSANKTVRNRLYGVYDHVGSGTFTDDIDSMVFVNSGAINTANNYSYDEEGRLIKDAQEQISNISWRVDGKVKSITMTSGSSKKNLTFDYENSPKADEGGALLLISKNSAGEMGHRIAKHQLSNSNVLEKSTYYVLDAQGNVMSTYEREINSPSTYFTQREKYIYGSARVGVLNDSIALLGSQNATYSQATWNHMIGKRNYELTNHLGNVLTVISDKPIPHTSGSLTDFFLADIRQSTDYSAFGVQLTGRTLTNSSVSKKFRYGYQNSEQDDEIKGDGNSYTTEYRLLDPRLGRWLTIDPVFDPSASPYTSMDNNPILLIDPFGLSPGHGNKSNNPYKEAKKFAKDHHLKKKDIITTERGFIINYNQKVTDIENEEGQKIGEEFSQTTATFTGNGAWQAMHASKVRSQQMLASGEWDGHGIFWHRDDESWRKWKQKNDNIDELAQQMLLFIGDLAGAGEVFEAGRLLFYGGKAYFANQAAKQTVKTIVTTAGGTEVKSFSIHSVNRAIERGVSPASILDALKNPLKTADIVTDEFGRQSQRYIGASAEVVINPQTGKIVSLNPTSSAKAARLLKQLSQISL